MLSAVNILHIDDLRHENESQRTQTDQNHRKIRQIQAEQHSAVVRGILNHRSLVERLFLLLVRGIFPEFQPGKCSRSRLSLLLRLLSVTHRRLFLKQFCRLLIVFSLFRLRILAVRYRFRHKFLIFSCTRG